MKGMIDPNLTQYFRCCGDFLFNRAVISSQQPAIVTGYSDENHLLLHQQNDPKVECQRTIRKISLFYTLFYRFDQIQLHCFSGQQTLN